jgi:peptidoglycan/LPS O-acetylase OafA/YrhL
VPARNHQESPERRLGALDALRLFAALAVVGFHFTARHSPGWNGPAPEELAGVGRFTAYGAMGVPLFFVISGFVLLMSAWGKGVPEFVASRVGRLFPAYWVAVAFSIVLVLYVWPENPAFLLHEISRPAALLNLTMLQGAFGVPDVDGVYWTLWYEARFYFLIALLMLVGLTRNRILAFALLWPIAGAIAEQAGSSLLTTLLIPDFSPFFAGGMLLYLIFRDGHDLGTWLLVALQVAVAVHRAIPRFTTAFTMDTTMPASPARIALLACACFALVALVTLTPASEWRARWMTAAGALTYPLYLMHENLGWYVIHLSRDVLGPWGAVLVATTFALLAAIAVHHLVERPFGARLRRATLQMMQTSTAVGGHTRKHAEASGHAAVSSRTATAGSLPSPRRARGVHDDAQPVPIA